MIRLAKMVETDHNGMPTGYSIAVVNDIDIEKCSWGEHYLFPDIETMKKYNAVFNKNWQWGYLQIYLMSNDDYWNEKIKLDKQMDEIQKRIDQLEMCYRTVHIDEDERNGYTAKNGFFHLDERCGTCKYVEQGRTYMQGLNDYLGWSKCTKTGKGVNDNAQEKCYEPKNGDRERKLLNYLTPQNYD